MTKKYRLYAACRCFFIYSSVELPVGDTVLTTSGFYGVIIDIQENDIIVEFGNNKNCRIPMQKAAVAQIEKASAE